MIEEYKRYISKVTKGNLKDRIVLVLRKGELCECYTEFETIEIIHQDELELYQPEQQ